MNAMRETFFAYCFGMSLKRIFCDTESLASCECGVWVACESSAVDWKNVHVGFYIIFEFGPDCESLNPL